MRQDQFLKVVDRDEAERKFHEALSPLVDLGSEQLDLDMALGRVLAEDVCSPIDVPGFDRSNMDGWAVRGADTFGASEQTPKLLRRVQPDVQIGQLPEAELGCGEAVAIPTGGALPKGADAVVLVEATELRGQQVEIRRAVLPGTALSFTGIDIARGETILRRGDRISSREIGVLAAVGACRVQVRCQPRIGILSTGDELVPPGQPIAPGQIYDSNAAILAAAVRECGGCCEPLGIVADDPQQLRDKLAQAIAGCDVVLLSGGTSKGPGDLNAKVLAEVLDPPGIVVHGVALKPGKPLCLAVSGRTPVVVLPGFPTSAIFTFHEFVAPLIRELAGLPKQRSGEQRALLPYRFRSDPGRREYAMVHLLSDESGQLLAYPIGKGSGSVTTWSQADGYIVVARHTEQLDQGSEVRVAAMAGACPRQADLVVLGSHCIGLDLLISELSALGFDSKLVAAGSEAGLAAAQRGACDIAPIHLLDATTGQYNHPFLSDGLELLEGYGRMQGVVYRRGDPRFENKAAAAAVREAVSDDSVTMINRNRGSGTRVLYDRLLGQARPAGYSVEASSHHAVAAAVQQKRADFGIAIDVVATDRELGFLPLTEERFDFAVPKGRRERPAVRAFAALLADERVRAKLAARGLLTRPLP